MLKRPYSSTRSTYFPSALNLGVEQRETEEGSLSLGQMMGFKTTWPRMLCGSSRVTEQTAGSTVGPAKASVTFYSVVLFLPLYVFICLADL